MRQLTDCYGSERGLHVCISGVFPSSDPQRPGEFNRMRPEHRVRIARAALIRAGVMDLAPARAMASDSTPVKPAARRPFQDRAARLHRALDKILDKLELRRSHRVSAPRPNVERRAENVNFVAADDASHETGAVAARLHGRAGDGHVLSDLERFQLDAARTTGGVI
jgi:hypothetical protein